MAHRFIVKPLGMITGALQAFTRGDFSTRFREQTSVKELGIMGGTFNAMANEVTQLKIENYENRLEKQRIELQYYQLQIKPHFLINILNMISMLAQAQRFELITELSMFAASYFRFTLGKEGIFVSLGEELKHVEDYLHIQQLRYPGRLKAEVAVENGLDRMAVLPLMIHSFVENSMQYAISMDSVTELGITARRHPDGRMELTVTDSGRGYPAWMLNRGERAEPDSSAHIGIHNVRERLLLAYGGHADLTIANSEQGGAAARILIPMEEC
jgi:two-component system sensor histidine kinase YesM